VSRRKSPNNSDPDRSNPYAKLRDGALSAAATGLPAAGGDHPDVSGLVVDIPFQGGFATIVAMTDNTTSMYTSTGGGTIGAGNHKAIATVTQKLLSVVQDNLGRFARSEDRGLPPLGLVRFHVVSPSEPRTQDVPEECFWGRTPHELIPVISATQAVVSAIRAVSDEH
jgi:hypothetical protein